MQYIGIGPERGKIVDSENAYDYAKAHLDDMSQEDKDTFIAFFFSGNWLEEE